MNKPDDYSRKDELCKMSNFTETKVKEIISTYCGVSVVKVLFDTTLETREGRENKIE